MPENPIYDFMKANRLTTKDEATFLKEYADSAKAKELYSFFQANKLTDKNFDTFYGTYLKKKVSIADVGMAARGGGEVGVSKAPSGLTVTGYETDLDRSIQERQRQATQINFDENDPIKSALLPIENKIAERRNRQVSSSTATPVSRLSESFANKELASEKSVIENSRFRDVKEAELFLFDKLDKSKLVPKQPLDITKEPTLDDFTDESKVDAAPEDNLTVKKALNQYFTNKEIREDIGSSASLDEAAIKNAIRKGDVTSKQITELGGDIPNQMKGLLVLNFLNNPDVREEANKNPELMNQVRQELFDLPEKYPLAAIRMMAEMVSKEMEQRGDNNAILNIKSKNSTDDILNELVERGDLPVQYKYLYDNPAVKLAVNSSLKTSGFVENLLSGAEQGFMGIGKTVAEVTGLRSAYSDKNERTFKALEKQYSDFAFKPKGWIHEISTHGGLVTGQVSSMMVGGGLIKAVGLVNSTKAANAIMAGLQTFGENKDRALVDLPGESGVKQLGYATVLTGVEIALANVLDDTKLAKSLIKGVSPEIKTVVTKFANKEITAAAAKKSVVDLFSNALSKSGTFVKGTANVANKEAWEEAVTEILQATTNQVFSGQPIELSQSAEDAFEVWRTTFLGSLFLGIGGGVVDVNKNPSMPKLIYEMAENPDKYIDIIEGQAAIDENYSKDVKQKIANLEYISKVKQDLDATEMSKRDKEKFLLASLNQKILSDQAESITEPTLKKKPEEKIKELEAVKQDILENPTKEEIELTPEQKIIQQAIDNNEVEGMFLDMAKAAVVDPQQAKQLLDEAKSQATGQVAGELGSARSGVEKAWGKTIADFVAPQAEAGSGGVGGDVDISKPKVGEYDGVTDFEVRTPEQLNVDDVLKRDKPIKLYPEQIVPIDNQYSEKESNWVSDRDIVINEGYGSIEIKKGDKLFIRVNNPANGDATSSTSYRVYIKGRSYPLSHFIPETAEHGSLDEPNHFDAITQMKNFDKVISGEIETPQQSKEQRIKIAETLIPSKEFYVAKPYNSKSGFESPQKVIFKDGKWLRLRNDDWDNTKDYEYNVWGEYADKNELAWDIVSNARVILKDKKSINLQEQWNKQFDYLTSENKKRVAGKAVEQSLKETPQASTPTVQEGKGDKGGGDVVKGTEVADKEGNPVVVYHGSGRGGKNGGVIEKFDESMVSKDEIDFPVNGFFFAGRKGEAQIYGGEKNTGSYYVDIKNPASRKDVEDAVNEAWNHPDYDKDKGEFHNPTLVRKILIDKGFDGYIPTPFGKPNMDKLLNGESIKFDGKYFRYDKSKDDVLEFDSREDADNLKLTSRDALDVMPLEDFKQAYSEKGIFIAFKPDQIHPVKAVEQSLKETTKAKVVATKEEAGSVGVVGGVLSTNSSEIKPEKAIEVDRKGEEVLGSKDFNIEFRNDVELQSDAKKEFAKEKGIKNFSDVPESEREKMQKEFVGYLEQYKKNHQTKVDKSKADNKTKFNELPIEQQRAIFHYYRRNNASSDYAVGHMIADGLLDYTSKKSGKAYGKVKGAEMSSNQIPVSVKWEFGRLNGELETSYPNLRHSKEEYIGRAIFNAIETEYDELGVPKETKKAVEQSLKETPKAEAGSVGVGGDVKNYKGMFNPKTTGISGLDDLLQDDGYNYFYKGVSGEVVMMSPDEYLKKVRTDITNSDKDLNILDEKKSSIIEGINKGDKINMPFLSLREDGRAHKQEGRNRATVAKERGEKLIPVFIEKDISFDDKIAKGQEYVNSAIKDGATTKEEVLSKLKEQGLHRDAIRFIDENFDNKAVEQSLKETPKAGKGIKSSWERNIEALINPETGLAATIRKMDIGQKEKDAFLERIGLTKEAYDKLDAEGKQKIQDQWVKSKEFEELSNKKETPKAEAPTPKPKEQTPVSETPKTQAKELADKVRKKEDIEKLSKEEREAIIDDLIFGEEAEMSPDDVVNPQEAVNIPPLPLKAGVGTITVKETLNHLINNKNKFSELAKEILENADIESLNADVSIAASKGFRSKYSSSKDRVILDVKDASNATIIIHEIIHATTSKKIPLNLKNPSHGNSYGKAYLKELQNYLKDPKGDADVKNIIRLYLKAVNDLGYSKQLFEGGEQILQEIEEIYRNKEGGFVVSFDNERESNVFVNGVKKAVGEENIKIQRTYFRYGGWNITINKVGADNLEKSEIFKKKETEYDVYEGEKKFKQKGYRNYVEFNRIVKDKASAGNADLTTKRGAPYGLGNLDEFLAEAFSSESFQKKLASIKDDSGVSLWQKFITAIKNLLGIETDGTLLNSVIKTGANIISKQRDANIQRLSELQSPINLEAAKERMREAGYSDSEIKAEFEKRGLQFESQQEPPKPPKEEPSPLEGDEGSRKKAVLNRLYNAKNTPEEAKKAFEREKLDYKPSSQKAAADLAKSIVDEFGVDEAVRLADSSSMFEGDVRTLIFAEVLNRLQGESNAKKWAEVAITMDKFERSAGRATAAVNYFYKNNPYGVVLKEQADRKEAFDKWATPKREQEWKEYFELIKKEPEFEKLFQERVSEELKKERAESRKNRIVKVRGIFKKAKDSLKSNNTYATIIPPHILETVLETMELAYEGGEAVATLIQDAIDSISKKLGHSNWDSDKFRKEWEEKLKEPSNIPLTEAEQKKKILDKFRNKLSGLTNKQKDEVVRKMFEKVVDAGALEYDDLRDIIADTLGYGELTKDESKRLQELVQKRNATDEAALKAREAGEDLRNVKNLPETDFVNKKEEVKKKEKEAEQALENYYKTEIEAGKAARELQELLWNKPDVVKRITSIMQLSTLGIPALINNPIYNFFNQIGVRFPVGFVNSTIDKTASLVAKAMGKPYQREYNIFETQGEFWSKLMLGTKESAQQLFTGLNRQDYIQKEYYGQQIRPMRALKDLINYKQGKKKLNQKQIWDKALQASVGVPAEVVARVLNLGDKPMRFSAEGSQAAAFAKTLGLKGIDYKLFIEFPREEAYRAYKQKGLTEEEASTKADYVKEAIIQEGKRATFQQDNILNDIITAAASIFGGKDSGFANLTKSLVISPYIKIPTNAFWSYYNLINPEVAILQSFIHAGRAKSWSSKGNEVNAKLQMREARYWMAHAITGMATRAVVIMLVQSGVYVSGSGDDESKKERDAKSFFEQPGSINISKLKALINGEDPSKVKNGLLISNRWIGQFGTVGNAIVSKYEDATPEQREAQDDFWRIVLGGMELDALKEMENGIFANSSSLLQSISNKDFSRYGTNTLNMFANILQPATFAQMNRAALDEVPQAKGDTFLQKLNQNFAQRSTIYRNMFNVRLQYKRNMWGETMPKGGNLLSRMFGISRVDDKKDGRPMYDDFLNSTDSGFLPPVVLPVLNGEKLNTEQHDRLQMYVGNERKSIVLDFINDKLEVPILGLKYSQMPNNETKKAALQYLYQVGRENGLKLFYKDFSELEPKEKSFEEQDEDELLQKGLELIKKENSQ